MPEPDFKLALNLVCDTCSKPLPQPIIEKVLNKTINNNTEALVLRIVPCENCPSTGIILGLNINNEKVEVTY